MSKRKSKDTYRKVNEVLEINCSKCRKWKQAESCFHKHKNMKYGYILTCRDCISISRGIFRKPEEIYKDVGDGLEINCSKCKQWKTAENHFSKCKSRKSGYYAYCKDCVSKKGKIHRSKSRIPSIYRIDDKEGNVLYVGKSTDIKKRIKQHTKVIRSSFTSFEDPSIIHKVYTKTYDSFIRSAASESYYISKYHPSMNNKEVYEEEEDDLMEAIAESVEWEEYDFKELLHSKEK